METVVKKLLEVVEHLTYSHTFRSEAAGNEARRLLGEARAALIEPAPAEESSESPAPVQVPPSESPAPAEIQAPAEPPAAVNG